MDKTAPVQYGDKLNGTSDHVWISKPFELKRIFLAYFYSVFDLFIYISFDGRFLHGAPFELVEIWNKKEESTVKQTKKRRKTETVSHKAK